MTGAWEPVSCSEYEELRANPAMRVHSACTNYVGGEVLNYWLPPHSYISHHDPAAGDHEQLRSWLDAAGCRHERLRGRQYVPQFLTNVFAAARERAADAADIHEGGQA